MTDYGHELELGYFLTPDGSDPRTFTPSLARRDGG